jgi:transposase-like protein
MIDAHADGVDVPTCYLDGFLLEVRDAGFVVRREGEVRDGILRDGREVDRFVAVEVFA